MDDFFGARPSAVNARRCMDIFQLAASSLGVKVNPRKCVGPTQCLVVLGIESDSVSQTARIDSDRLMRMVTEVTILIERGTALRRELERVIGLLVCATRVIPLGRPFLRSLWSAVSSTPRIPSRRRIPNPAIVKLQWWLALLRDWNGIRLLRPAPTAQVRVWTNASGVKGAGGHLEAPPCLDAFAYQFPRRHREKDITVKEMHAVLHAARLWAPLWRGAHVTFYIDNHAIADRLPHGTIKHNTAQTLFRSFWLIAAQSDFTFSTVWVPSEENSLADALSRQNWSRANLFDPSAVLFARKDRSLPPLPPSRPSSPTSLPRPPVSCSVVSPSLPVPVTSPPSDLLMTFAELEAGAICQSLS